MNRRKEALIGYLFASPWLLGMSVFLLYPLVSALYYSFCDYSVLKPPMTIGTANYIELYHDAVFRKAVANTFIYAAFALPTGLISALVLAMLLNAKLRGQNIYRTLFFLPSLVPAIPMAVLWNWLLNGQFGIFNVLIGKIVYHPPNWLGDPAWTKPSLVLMGTWGVGNTMLIYLASLQDVPTSLIEAAELDGASSWQKTRNVTLPMISPVILFNSVMGLIGSLQIFAQPFVMFPLGGPEQSAYFYSTYLYDKAFRDHAMGYACAMGWIMFIVIFILTLALIKFSEKRVHYGGT